MSRVTDIVIISHCGLEEQTLPLRLAIENHLNESQTFNKIDGHCGGLKWLQLGVWACAANYADEEKVLDTLNHFNFDTDFTNYVLTVIVQLEEGGTYHFVKAPDMFVFTVKHFDD